MNTTFTFSRFLKVVKHDALNLWQNHRSDILVFIIIPAALWIGNLVINTATGEHDYINPDRRFANIVGINAIVAALMPIVLYRNVNLRGEGNYFAMLPASLCEKFTSLSLFSFILMPLAVFLGGYLLDILLTLLPFGGYKEYIWTHTPVIYESSNAFGIAPAWGFILALLQSFSLTAYFLFFNTVFKKNKFIKTIIWTLVGGFVLSLLAVIILSRASFSFLLDYDWEHLMPKHLFWFIFGCEFLWTALFTFFTYRRLKKMQY